MVLNSADLAATIVARNYYPEASRYLSYMFFNVSFGPRRHPILTRCIYLGPRFLKPINLQYSPDVRQLVYVFHWVGVMQSITNPMLALTQHHAPAARLE